MNNKEIFSNQENEDNNKKPEENLEYKGFVGILSKKIKEIFKLKKEINEKTKLNADLINEVFSLKRNRNNILFLQNQIDEFQLQNKNLKVEIEILNNKLLEQQKKYMQEKREQELKYVTEINRLKGIIDTYVQKNIRSNMNELDNQKLNIQMSQLKEISQKIILTAKQDLLNKDTEIKLKASKLKNKFLDNIKEIKDDFSKLNINYMDMSTKLILLQNHQLLIKLNYQENQLQEIMKKNELLEKEISKLKNENEIHKEVEINFAEKNNKLVKEFLKQKKNDKSNIVLEDKEKENDSLISKNSPDISKINLEKKIINLEKKLKFKHKEYIELKNKNEYIENNLKNQTKKYSNLYSFFDESLNMFYKDEEINNMMDLNINISEESLKNLDFNSLTKKEKISILIILMKYLMPIINFEKNNLKQEKNNIVKKYNLKYHFNTKNKILEQDKLINKKNITRNNSNNNDNFNIRLIKIKKSNLQSFESLPSIGNSVNYKKINANIPKSTSFINTKSINI